MVVSNESYEELRKRRMEENKRRMEELHLHQLTQALKPVKPPPMKRTQPRKIVTGMVEVRRSNRVANKPAPVFNQIVAKGSSRSPAMTKAVEVRLSLGTDHPSCIKMLKGPQAVTACSNTMAFPPWFGKLFLPKSNSEMVIEDENGEIHLVKYLAKICRLSAGWNMFKFGHNLLVGDVLVFHLVEPYKFKVYIVRVNDLKKANDLITRLHLEARTKQMTPETDTLSPTPKKTKRGKPVSKPDVPFQELKAFQDFHIMVKGVCIDSKHPDDFEAWDTSLKSFSQLGMEVGFLSERIATRSRLMFESENRLDIERYMEAKTEHKHIEDEIKSFTDDLKKLEESSRKIQEDLKHKAGKYEVKFQEEVPY